MLTRQGLPTLPGVPPVERGAYVLADGDDCILIGTGSEVHVALAARELLAADGISARVVSMPSFELFRAQEAAYRDEVLPPALRARVAVEAASPFGWYEWVGIDGAVVGDRPFRRLRAGRRGPRGAGHHRGGGGGGRDGPGGRRLTLDMRLRVWRP